MKKLTIIASGFITGIFLTLSTISAFILDKQACMMFYFMALVAVLIGIGCAKYYD